MMVGFEMIYIFVCFSVFAVLRFGSYNNFCALFRCSEVNFCKMELLTFLLCKKLRLTVHCLRQETYKIELARNLQVSGWTCKFLLVNHLVWTRVL